MNTIKFSNVSCAQLRKILKRAGFSYDHIKGDHEIWTKDGASRPCVFPTSHEPLAEFIVKNVIKTAGISLYEAASIIFKVKTKRKP